MNTKNLDRNGEKRLQRGTTAFPIERFESRVLFSSVVVNTNADVIDTTGSGVTSFADALAIANANTSKSGTIITFDPTVFSTAMTMYTYESAATITNTAGPVQIIGPAAGLTIEPDPANVELSDQNIITIAAGATASISDITLSDGFDASDAGGLINAGTLTLTGCTITGNSSGGVDDQLGQFSGRGGGIDNSGMLTMIDSTLSGNTTIAGPNTDYAPADQFGGGLLNSGVATLINDTVTNNTSDSGSAAYGGGIDNTGTLTLANTILAGNTATHGPDLYGTVISKGHNLIGDAAGSNGWTASDLVGSEAHPLSPKLGALAHHQGATLTQLPLTGSPAIGAGDASLIPGTVTTDQRGLPRTNGGKVDIGAVELQTPPAGLDGSILVSTIPATIVAGTSFHSSITLTLTNNSGSVETARFHYSIIASATGDPATSSFPITEGNGDSRILANGRRTVHLAVSHLADVTQPGLYTLLIQSADATGNIVTVDSGFSTTVDAAKVSLSEFAAAETPGDQLPPAISGQPLNLKMTVNIANYGNVASAGSTLIDLILVDESGNTVGSPIATTTRGLTIKPTMTKTVVVPIRKTPEISAGSYYLEVRVTDPYDHAVSEGDAGILSVTAPVIQLAVAFPTVTINTVIQGATLEIENNGNISDVSSLTAEVGFATDPAGHNIVASGPAILKAGVLHINPGKASKVHVSGWDPIVAEVPDGAYYFTTTISDADGNKVIAVSTTPILTKRN